MDGSARLQTCDPEGVPPKVEPEPAVRYIVTVCPGVASEGDMLKLGPQYVVALAAEGTNDTVSAIAIAMASILADIVFHFDSPNTY